MTLLDAAVFVGLARLAREALLLEAQRLQRVGEFEGRHGIINDLAFPKFFRQGWELGAFKHSPRVSELLGEPDPLDAPEPASHEHGSVDNFCHGEDDLDIVASWAHGEPVFLDDTPQRCPGLKGGGHV